MGKVLFDGIVEATVFEPQTLAYAPADAYLKDPELIGVALPYRLSEEQRKALRVTVSYYGKRVDNVPIVDVGPWNTTDDYFLVGERPKAEAMYENGIQADNGQIPVNKAGVDLTEELARELEFPGLGEVELKVEVVDMRPFRDEKEIADNAGGTSVPASDSDPIEDTYRDDKGRLRDAEGALVCDWCGSKHRKYLVYLPQIDYDEKTVAARWVCKRCAHKLIGKAALKVVFGRGWWSALDLVFRLL